MDHDTSGISPERGMTIIGSDGEEVGEIDLVESRYVIVKKGGIFPQDYYIARSDIAGQDDDGRLRLSLPAQEALDRGLGNPTGALGGDEHTADADPATLDRAPAGEIETDVSSADERAPGDATAGGDDVETTAAPERAPETSAMDDEPAAEPLHAEAGIDAHMEPARDDMHRTVSLTEEELTATTRNVERGVVRVEKRIVEERQTLEVPLVDEEVEVTRRRVDREIREGDRPFEERTIEIPLHGQAVEIEKHAHVVEEIDIDKTAHERMQQVTETVRRETAEVEGDDLIELPEDTNTRPNGDDTTAT